eukprot:CAMPEP_0204363786 /NCGR_PEP_ID=MMETSP0469-20131031/40631_1 /ASSEMBLY_ACC=CAM_ASM_000384 /TAXON_ID=2969 /ORGANISM="Oxyrrhis marina" /LENGTH=36 /DNA_ID= /DNA_START= /DNA_END= /DNA_ORIENTATION=
MTAANASQTPTSGPTQPHKMTHEASPAPRRNRDAVP